MPPKKATSAAGTTKPKAAPTHAPYQDMIEDGILKLKERNGSSRQALKKYIKANNKVNEGNFDRSFNTALAKGVKAGKFVQPKGPSGPVKLQKKEAAKSATKPVKAAGEKKQKPAVKKAAGTVKKATTTKAAAKPKAAAAAKPKATTANSKKSRTTTKTATDKALTKTKTGRVAKPKSTPKKKATTTAAATKKSTPKKKKADAPAASASADAA